MKKFTGGLAGLCLVLVPAIAYADIGVAAQAGMGGAEGRPFGTRLGFDFMYGMVPYFRWGGDFYVQGGEPFLRLEFGPKLQLFLKPVGSGLLITTDVALGPSFFQNLEGRYDPGAVARYGSGVGWEFETGGGSVNPFFLLGAHGVTRIDGGTDVFGHFSIGINIPSSSSPGGYEE